MNPDHLLAPGDTLMVVAPHPDDESLAAGGLIQRALANDARVHIVLPDTPQLGQPVKPSSAAVFIKHRPGVDLDFFVPQIRRLVSSSIEGLQYGAVTVVLAEATPTKLETPTEAGSSGNVEVLPGLAIKDADRSRFWQIAMGVGALIGLLIAGNLVLLFFYLRDRRGKRPTVTAAVPMVEPS